MELPNVKSWVSVYSFGKINWIIFFSPLGRFRRQNGSFIGFQSLLIYFFMIDTQQLVFCSWRAYSLTSADDYTNNRPNIIYQNQSLSICPNKKTSANKTFVLTEFFRWSFFLNSLIKWFKCCANEKPFANL